MRKVFAFLFVIVFTGLFMFACKKQDEEKNNGEEKEVIVNLDETSVKLKLGEKHLIELEFIDGTGTIEYRIEDKSIIRIEDDQIIPINPGKTKVFITVTIDDSNKTKKEFTIDVEVVEELFTITYASNVEGFSKASETVARGEVKTLTEIPTIEGYRFVGWFFMMELGYKNAEEFEVTEDVTVYAIFDPKEFEIYYELYGATYSGVDKAKYGDVIQLGTPVKEGYDFAGWILEGSEDDYVTEVTVTDDIFLEANFTLKVYNITMELDGGTYTGDATVKHGQVLVLKQPTKEHYTFLGWSLEKGSTDYIYRITGSSDLTIYANYVLKEYTVKFELAGGSYDGSNKVKYGETLTLGTPTKNGFTFLGWSLNKGSNVYVTEIIGSGDITVYADFEEVKDYPEGTYPIRYYLNGGHWLINYKLPSELGLEFMEDFKSSSGRELTPDKLDCNNIESSWFGDMMQNKTYLDKWMWLLDAIWEVNEGSDDLKADKADFTSLDVRGFYLANLNGFFTSTQHKDTYIGPMSANFADEEVSMAVYSKGTPLSGDTIPTTYVKGVGLDKFPTPLKEGFEFVHFEDESGNVVSSISTTQEGKLVLIAIWKEETKPEDVVIKNNIEDGIKLYSSLQLEWDVVPNEAVNKKVFFYSLTATILTVTEDGLIKANGTGTGKIRIRLKGNPDFEKVVEIKVWSGEYFDVSYETESYVTIGKTIHLNASYIDKNEEAKDVTWSSLNTSIATVDASGNVTGVSDGLATIRATYTDGIYFDFYVTVVKEELSDVMKFILENHISNASTTYDLGVGSGTPEYYYDVISGVNNILFDDLKIDYRYYDQLPLGTKNYGLMSSVEFITVHYTGNMKEGADADNNCSYFNNLEYRASIHFVTGRTNLTDLTGQSSGYNADSYYAFAGLSEKYAGWHATNADPCIWDDTGLEVLDGDPLTPIISISSNKKYTINGRETKISIPAEPSGYVVNGDVLTVNGKQYTVFNQYGLITKVVDGKYYLARTHWGTQRDPRCICTCGGNLNSLGIESCVDKGSDLEHTWHVTAQLVAKLLLDNNLGFDRVVGHHFFSGKDCPQVLLTKDMKLWYEFMDMVKAEYELLTTYKDAEITCIAVNDDNGVLRDNGLITQDDEAHCVTYEVTVTINGKTEKITLATCVESFFKCDCKRTKASLQIEGVPVI